MPELLSLSAAPDLPIAGDRLVLGSDRTCELRLEGLALEHLAFEWSPEGYRVVPLAEAIFVEDEQVVGPTLLRAGALLRVGEFTWRVRDRSDACSGLPERESLLGRIRLWQDAGLAVDLVRFDLSLPVQPEARARSILFAGQRLLSLVARGAVLSRSPGGDFELAGVVGTGLLASIAHAEAELFEVGALEVRWRSTQVEAESDLATALEALDRELERPRPAGVGLLARSESGLRLLEAAKHVLRGPAEFRALLDLMLGLLVAHTKAERGSVFWLNKSGALELLASKIPSGDAEAQALSRGLIDACAREGRSVLVRDALEDPRYLDRKSVLLTRLRSALVVPIPGLRGRVLGVIYLDSRGQVGQFDAVDQQLLEAFAELVAGPLEGSKRLSESAAAGPAPEFPAGWIGSSEVMAKALALAQKFADSDLPISIVGESGVGKGLLARSIHDWSTRSHGPYEALDLTAVPEGLIETTLFGHVAGAYTGAAETQAGVFERSHLGTLYLDGIDRVSLPAQAILLRAIQEGTVRKVGSQEELRCDVRVVCSSPQALRTLVDEGRLRADLYYRLNVLEVVIPPLRERLDDAVALAEAYLAERDSRWTLSPEAKALLARQAWPGNVRQLHNELARLTVLSDPSSISLVELSSLLGGEQAVVLPSAGTLKEAVEALERDLIREALERHGQNQARAARALGLSKSAFHRKVHAYGLL